MTLPLSDPSDVAPTEIERCAGHLLVALETLIGPDSQEAWQAEQFDNRLRFAMERVADLRQGASVAGGVFEPARLEVAMQILDGHAVRAARFLDDVAEQRLRAAARRYQPRRTVDTRVDDMPPLARERAA